MINIAICDDDLQVSNKIEDLLSQPRYSNFYVDCFASGTDLLRYITSNQNHYNIFLLDIEMPGLSGIATATQIRQTDSSAIIIFITSHKDYVYDVFEVLPFRFIRKPLNIEELEKALDDATTHLNNDNKIFFFHIGHEKFQVFFKDIIYFESKGRKICVYTLHDSWVFYGRIADIMNTLAPDCFVQIHGSYIVNLEAITIIRQQQLVLNTQTELPISRSFSKSVREAHMNFLKRRGGLL